MRARELLKSITQPRITKEGGKVTPCLSAALSSPHTVLTKQQQGSWGLIAVVGGGGRFCKYCYSQPSPSRRCAGALYQFRPAICRRVALFNAAADAGGANSHTQQFGSEGNLLASNDLCHYYTRPHFASLRLPGVRLSNDWKTSPLSHFCSHTTRYIYLAPYTQYIYVDSKNFGAIKSIYISIFFLIYLFFMKINYNTLIFVVTTASRFR